MAKKKTRRRYTRKPKRRRKRDNRIPIATVLGIVTGVTRTAPSGNTLISRAQHGDWQGFLYDAKEIFTGMDTNNKLQLHWLVQTYLPMITGALVSKFVGKFVNTHIKKIPVLGKYVKI